MFALEITITPSSIDSIKANLLRALPHVKSCHRVEAIARAFDFRTYAAMLTAAKSSERRVIATQTGPFREYLEEHELDAPDIHFYRAAARVAVSIVMDHTPQLSMRGYGAGQPQRRCEEKRWETPEETYERFTKNRGEFLSDNGLDEFLRALALVQLIPATRAIRNAGSYRLKHLAENLPIIMPDGMELGPAYVANGALIAAALHAGFKMKTYRDELGYNHINATFNMSKKVVDDLDCELRPRGGLARDRAWLPEFQKRKRLGQSTYF
jgi:hypothetical protein